MRAELAPTVRRIALHTICAADAFQRGEGDTLRRARHILRAGELMGWAEAWAWYIKRERIDLGDAARQQIQRWGL